MLAGAFCIRGSGLRGVGGPIDITGITASDGVQFIRREEVRRAEPELQMVGPASPAVVTCPRDFGRPSTYSVPLADATAN